VLFLFDKSLCDQYRADDAIDNVCLALLLTLRGTFQANNEIDG
jgi:hypothetical protein